MKASQGVQNRLTRFIATQQESLSSLAKEPGALSAMRNSFSRPETSAIEPDGQNAPILSSATKTLDLGKPKLNTKRQNSANTVVLTAQITDRAGKVSRQALEAFDQQVVHHILKKAGLSTTVAPTGRGFSGTMLRTRALRSAALRAIPLGTSAKLTMLSSVGPKVNLAALVYVLAGPSSQHQALPGELVFQWANPPRIPESDESLLLSTLKRDPDVHNAIARYNAQRRAWVHQMGDYPAVELYLAGAEDKLNKQLEQREITEDELPEYASYIAKQAEKLWKQAEIDHSESHLTPEEIEQRSRERLKRKVDEAQKRIEQNRRVMGNPNPEEVIQDIADGDLLLAGQIRGSLAMRQVISLEVPTAAIRIVGHDPESNDEQSSSVSDVKDRQVNTGSGTNCVFCAIAGLRGDATSSEVAKMADRDESAVAIGDIPAVAESAGFEHQGRLAIKLGKYQPGTVTASPEQVIGHLQSLDAGTKIIATLWWKKEHQQQGASSHTIAIEVTEDWVLVRDYQSDDSSYDLEDYLPWAQYVILDTVVRKP